MSATNVQPPDDRSRLLNAILNLSAFHRDHEKFYASDPRERAVELQFRTRVEEIVSREHRAPGN